ncbi:MAG: hypothetical protein QW279_09220 [Candidatus Jordarchaeaceae archaeon]
MSTKIILERLKELLSQLDIRDLGNLDAKLDSCWEECRKKERDPSISRDLINENRRILQEISIALEVYQVGAIDSKKLQEIKTNLLKM